MAWNRKIAKFLKVVPFSQNASENHKIIHACTYTACWIRFWCTSHKFHLETFLGLKKSKNNGNSAIFSDCIRNHKELHAESWTLHWVLTSYSSCLTLWWCFIHFLFSLLSLEWNCNRRDLVFVAIRLKIEEVRVFFN